MSRNSKQAQRMVKAREISKSRVNGAVGSKWTEPKHGKAVANREPQNRHPRPTGYCY